MKKKIIVLLSFVSILAISCSSSDNGTDPGPDPVSFERKAMLENWADNIIIPSYADFILKLEGLETAKTTFASDVSTENLVSLRTAWVTAYKSWQTVSMFEIGPAETAGLRLNVNTYPTSITKVTSNITSGGYNLSLSSNRDTKGFPALDYLLNGLAATDTEIVAMYTNVDLGAKRLTYLNDVVLDIKTLSNTVNAGWGTYRGTFVSNDGASATASVDKFVNDYIFYFEKFLRAGKMGIPGGVFGNDPTTEKLEALYYNQDLSKELFLVAINSFQDFFNGKHFGKSTSGESLNTYLIALKAVQGGANLNVLINDQLSKSKTAVAALGTFNDEIADNPIPTNFLSAYDQVQLVVPLLKVDMASAMSISIDFVDADGD